MKESERDQFYSPPQPPSDGGDDDEFELEPPDETINERRRQDALETITRTIDVDEIYRQADHDRGTEILEEWVRNFRFRFQVKHLLILTAVLAIVLTLFTLQVFWVTLVVTIMLSVAGLFAYLRWQDHKHQAEAAKIREAMYARRRAQLEASTGVNSAGQPLGTELLPETPPLPNQVDEIWQKSLEEQSFRFRFSLKELLVIMTLAAVLLGLMRLLGGPEASASVLGLVALGGLAAHALGAEPRQYVVLGWWVTLVLYVISSIAAIVWRAIA